MTIKASDASATTTRSRIEMDDEQSLVLDNNTGSNFILCDFCNEEHKYCLVVWPYPTRGEEHKHTQSFPISQTPLYICRYCVVPLVFHAHFALEEQNHTNSNKKRLIDKLFPKWSSQEQEVSA
jgi:hypothetical protein